jgi:hypothetical protein
MIFAGLERAAARSLDGVSSTEMAISVRRGGKRASCGKYASDPALRAEEIRNRAPAVKRLIVQRSGVIAVSFRLYPQGVAGLDYMCKR